MKFQVEDHGLQYVGAARIDGSMVFVERVRDVGYDELVEIRDQTGNLRLGRVLDISELQAVVQVFEGTTGLSNQHLRAGSSARTSACRSRGRCWDVCSTGWADRWTAVHRRCPRTGAT